MPSNRYYIDSSFAMEQELLLEGDEFSHLSHVMRAQAHEEIELINGSGHLAQAEILELSKRHARLLVRSISSAPAPLPLTLAVPFCRSSKMDWIVEKGCELGVTAFWIYPAEKGERECASSNQQQRWRNLLIAAIKQCGRLDLPAISMAPPLSKWEKRSTPILFGDTHSEAPWLVDLLSALPKEALLFVIGPEAGLSSNEEDLLKGQLGAKGVKLHRNILRLETAAMAAAALLSQRKTSE